MLNRAWLIHLVAAIVVIAGFVTPTLAEDFTPEQRKKIEAIVQDYIMNNPALVRDALTKLERQREEAEVAQRAKVITDQASVLFNSTRQAEVGNPDGDVVIVEFFDYNCGYCRRALNDLVKLLDTDKKLRVVLKEFPVLGQKSVEAAQVSIAVQMQAPDKYMEFHTRMLTAKGQSDKNKALRVAEEMGLDMNRLAKDMASPEVSKTIEEVYTLANGLGLTGTPSYVVGDEAVFGAVGFAQLQKKISDFRNCGSTTC